jgi:hypothetical protein
LQDTPEARRKQRRQLHLAFLLAETDPRQREFVQNRLDQLAPADLGVAAHFLQPHAEQVRRDLWPVLQQELREHDTEGLALAGVLVRLDPGAEEWRVVAGDLATTLSSVRPFELPEWTVYFRPIKKSLLSPLLKQLEDATSLSANQRSNVIDLLAIYAADHPETLVAALEDVGAEEFALIFEPLKMHGEQAAAALRNRFVALGRHPAATNDTDNAPMVSQLAQTLSKHSGTLTPQAAVALCMPRDVCSQVCDELFRFGYRPASYRPYSGSDGEYVAVCWSRDGREFRTAEGLAAAELIHTDEQHRREGFRIADAAMDDQGLSDGEASVRFAGLWVKASPDVGDVRMYVGESLETHATNAERWAEEGYLLLRFFQWTDPTGQPLCSAIWLKQDIEDDRTSFTRSRYAYAFGDLYPGYLQTDCRVSALDTHRQATLELHANRLRYEGGSSASERTYLALYLSSLGLYDRAIELCDDLIESLPKNSKLSEIRAVALAGKGDEEALREEVHRYENLQGSPQVLASLRVREAVLTGDPKSAKIHLASLASQLEDAPDDAELTVAVARANALTSLTCKEEEDRTAHVARAIQLLHRAVLELELENPEVMVRNVDFDPLRQEASFQKLVRESGLHCRYDGVFCKRYYAAIVAWIARAAPSRTCRSPTWRPAFWHARSGERSQSRCGGACCWRWETIRRKTCPRQISSIFAPDSRKWPPMQVDRRCDLRRSGAVENGA